MPVATVNTVYDLLELFRVGGTSLCVECGHPFDFIYFSLDGQKNIISDTDSKLELLDNGDNREADRPEEKDGAQLRMALHMEENNNNSKVEATVADGETYQGI